MYLLGVDDLHRLIDHVGLASFYQQLIDRLRHDFARWDEFIKYPRHATQVEGGVIELMPICDHEYYAYKYVNGHPANPKVDKQTVVATGMLADVATGYPLLMSEMTLLTALRTSATAALAASFALPKGTKQMALIGLGAQAEFLALAHHFHCGVETLCVYDPDEEAVAKFVRHMQAYPVEVKICLGVREAIEGCALITTATAKRERARILQYDWLQWPCHINGMGGDCPGKTELDEEIVRQASLIVEYWPQTKEEGEVQYFAGELSYMQLSDLCSGKVALPNSDLSLFDSVGFALEDYSVLRLVYQYAQEFASSTKLIPALANPKDLFMACS